MTVIELGFDVAVLLIFFGLVAYFIWLVFPMAQAAIARASERARIERQAQEASWEIHQRATRAFGEMLEAAREARDHEDRQ